MECPICMDCLDYESNCIVTECGHKFHANCLMTSVAHNGFGCPCCRTEMAKEPEESVYDSDEDDDESFDADPNDDIVWSTTNSALRGARWMFQRIENDDQDDEEDIEISNETSPADNATMSEDDSTIETNDICPPSAKYVSDKLMQTGITVEELVNYILTSDYSVTDQYMYSYTKEEQKESNKVFGQIRKIVCRYNNQQPRPLSL